MSWASRRRIVIVASLVATAIAIVAVVAFLFLYKVPTCMDGKQNGDERGIDCGGSSCAYRCVADEGAPVARFVRPLMPQPERTDIIAYIDNPNTDAAVKGARYTLELYGADHRKVGTRDGSIDLPAGGTVPLFTPGALSGPTVVTQAFITFATSSLKWFASEPVRNPLGITDTVLTQGDEPRLTATLTNPTATRLSGVKAVAALYGADSTIIAASQTAVPGIPGQGSVSIIFTWTQPFSGPVVRTEILPILPTSSFTPKP